MRQQPGERELRRSAAFFLSDGLEAFDESAVFDEIVAHEAWVATAGVARVEMGEIGNGAGEQAAAERSIGEKGDAEVTGQLARLGRLLAVEQREFALYRGERVGGMGPADALGPRLAEPDEADLTRFDEPRHGPDRLLDRHRRIDAVLVIEIDDLDPEPLQARLAGLGDIGGAAVDPVGAARPAGLAEFAGEHDAVAPALERPAEQLLVLTPAIHVRAVEVVDAELDRPVDQRNPRLLLAGAVDAGQRHAAETDRRDLRSHPAEPAPLRDHRAAHRYLLIPV